ncbi:MAG: M1 family aminopeptidase [Chlamydiota bacterium]
MSHSPWGLVRGLALGVALTILISVAYAAEPAPNQPNSDPVYQQLRNLGLSGEAVTVKELVLKRDAATLTFHSGTICFLTPVQGKVTGAVFSGDGSFRLTPPIGGEKRAISLLSGAAELNDSFTGLALRFTDATYTELKAAGSQAAGSCNTGALQDARNAMRQKLHYNLDARILADVLSPDPGGLFLAFIHGKKYGNKMLFEIDPHGLPDLQPEEVEFLTFDAMRYGVWSSFHLAGEYASGTASSDQHNGFIHIEHQQLDTEIEKNASLAGKAATTVVAQSDGVRMVPFDLFGQLRVQSVTAGAGQPLSFIQEDKNDDPDYWVILPAPLAKGDKFTIVTQYSGKGAVTNEGGGNYYPVARSNWYPNSWFGDYATYDLIFRIPKGMKMAATGTLVSDKNEGNSEVSQWHSEVPLAVAGFNFGKFKEEEGRLPKLDYLVESFANKNTPDIINNIQNAIDPNTLPHSNATQLTERPEAVLGTMGTTPLMKKALAEGELAVQIFSDYFGPLPYKQLAITQQTAFDYGQSWPGLVYLPITYFFDTTTRHGLGMDDARGYFKVVAPHEVAHQWWGHEVGFGCYRDQWMSEGFADFSASIYLQAVYKGDKEFHSFWKDERDLLLQRNKEGFRAIDAGPVTLGYRLSTTRAGYDIPRRLIYPKGAYILQMIRMMMWDSQTGDQQFKALMHDFAQTYANRTATTEDFKTMVEKHMTVQMDLDGNHRMDWFFNEYVYGTALPNYDFSYSFGTAPGGDVVLNIKLAESNVDDNFRMLLPLYLELPNGAIVNLGRARLQGNTTLQQQIPLRGLKQTPKRAMINYMDDVLATGN